MFKNKTNEEKRTIDLETMERIFRHWSDTDMHDPVADRDTLEALMQYLLGEETFIKSQNLLLKWRREEVEKNLDNLKDQIESENDAEEEYIDRAEQKDTDVLSVSEFKELKNIVMQNYPDDEDSTEELLNYYKDMFVILLGKILYNNYQSGTNISFMIDEWKTQRKQAE